MSGANWVPAYKCDRPFAIFSENPEGDLLANCLISAILGKLVGFLGCPNGFLEQLAILGNLLTSGCSIGMGQKENMVLAFRIRKQATSGWHIAFCPRVPRGRPLFYWNYILNKKGLFHTKLIVPHNLLDVYNTCKNLYFISIITHIRHNSYFF